MLYLCYLLSLYCVLAFSYYNETVDEDTDPFKNYNYYDNLRFDFAKQLL